MSHGKQSPVSEVFTSYKVYKYTTTTYIPLTSNGKEDVKSILI